MEVDKSNFRQIINDFLNQASAELNFFNQLCLTRRSFDKIIICGMGGSAQIGDFFDYFKSKRFTSLSLKIPVLVHRSYNLPAEANEQSLIICISYSGNTEETISAFEAAKSKDLEITGIASGGQLEKLFNHHKIPWIKIPDHIPPRTSLGYQLNALIKILMAYGLLLPSASSELEKLPNKISSSSIENQAKLFCHKLERKIPVIYTSNENMVLGRIWKIKFNENTKIPSFYNVLPELNHNEMNGWEKNLGPFHIIFLKDEDDLPRVKKRTQVTAEILKTLSLPVDFIDLQGDNALEKLFWGLLFGDWLSYHLALYYGINPQPVNLVEELKKKMKE